MGKTLNETKHKNNFDIQVQCISRILDSENSEADCLLIVNGSNEFELPVDILVDDKEFPKALAKNKIAVKREQRTNLQNYLIEEYNRLKSCNTIVYRHTRLGWLNMGDYDLFLTGENDFENFKSVSNRINFEFCSGDNKLYYDFLIQYVFNNDNLTLAVAIGLSAVIVSRLKDKINLGTIIFNFCGATSTGKTTAAMLAASLFAAPTKKGLVFNFNATTNALAERLMDIHGMPMIIDDILVNEKIDVSQLIYSLAEGSNKDRCSTSGKIKSESNESFSGTIILTSEYPVLDCGNNNQGLIVRVLATNNIVWTPTAETSDLIKRIVLENYGWAGNAFAEYISNIPLQTLYQSYSEAKQSTHNIMPDFGGYTDRLEKQYAVIYLTVELMKVYFNVNLNAAELLEILLKAEIDNVKEHDNADKALEAVKGYILKHRSNFELKTFNKATVPQLGEYNGAIIQGVNAIEVYLLSEIVDEIFNKVKIRDSVNVKRKWKKDGVIKSDKNRFDCKYSKSFIKNKRFIHFYFDEFILEEITDNPPFDFNKQLEFESLSTESRCNLPVSQLNNAEMYEPPAIPQYALDFFKDFDEYLEGNYNG